MSHFKVVDLGTKKGYAIGVFRERARMYYGADVQMVPARLCLGVDRNDKYRAVVEEQGYQFHSAIIHEADFLFPVADYYLAWDFLEHLPNTDVSNNVLTSMLCSARKGVWLKMPSFEQDERGEGQLRRHGLRFAWSHWKGHKCHYTLADALGVITKTLDPSKHKMKHKHQRIIKDSSSKFIVPVDAPPDTTEYTPELGPKPEVKFDPPVIGCHELIVFLE